MTTLPITNFHRQNGFSLIEALVAFLILSVGMLGIASLQTISLKAGYTATLRSSAVKKDEAILERMRANLTDVALGAASNYNVSTGGGLSLNRDCSDSTGTVVTCTSDQMAQYDVYEWKQDIINEFPSGTTASITVADPAQPNTPNAVTVTIRWTERDPSSANGTINMTYTSTQML